MDNCLKAALSVEQLKVSYEQNKKRLSVLDGISFVLEKGEILALLGESGSGKSTCGKTLIGVLPPSAKIDKGTVCFGNGDNVDISDNHINWKAIRGTRVGMIYQDAQLALNPVKTIRAHFEEILKNKLFPSKGAMENVYCDILRLLNFDDPELVLNAYPFELSGGMCQRVYIAMILSLEPEVLIADEPTSALDTVSQKEVLQLLRNTQKKLGISVLLITHDIGVVYEISDRVIVLNEGKIVEQGTVHDVLLHPKEHYTKQLIEARNLPAFSRQSSMCREPLLQIERIKKTFQKGNKRKNALNQVDLIVCKGETIGILGFSGCGKSTLAKCITGLEMPDQGKIMYNGQDISMLHGRKRQHICKSLQIVFQDARASLNPRRSALELVQEPLKYLKIGTAKDRTEKALFYLRSVGIEGDVLHRSPPQLSTGQCQRIAIARALIVEPDLLICDEAVSALDMILQKQILDLLLNLQKSIGFAYIMISHDARVIRHSCERVAIMNNGFFVDIVSTDRLTAQSENKFTCQLLSCAGNMDCPSLNTLKGAANGLQKRRRQSMGAASRSGYARP